VPTAPHAIDALLHELVRRRASDLHLKPKRPPLVRVDGRLIEVEGAALEPAEIERLLDPIIPEHLRERLRRELAIDFGYGLEGVSRFRASVYYQRGTRAAVFRRVPFDFPGLEDWGLPPVLSRFCEAAQGLVLITGPTGSGKSSTLAALIRRVAGTRRHHVVTIEDPIEFLIADDLASVSQREIGIDTPSFSTALRSILRQDPDVIMVGEMRDPETIRTVLTAAETGHLVFSTLHTNGAAQTVDRIMNDFPEGSHRQLRQQLAACLEGIVSLQLLPRAGGTGMVAAVEILRRSPRISKLILEGKFELLAEEIESSVPYYKMQSMNQSLAALLIHGAIARETATAASPSPGDLDLLLRRIVGAGASSERGQGEEMAECTSDFSKILELQEIAKHHDELEARHAEELAERDRSIAELRAELSRLADGAGEAAQSAELRRLQAENERIATQLGSAREEYEAKIERLNLRLRELSSKVALDAEPDPGRKSLFRR